MSEFWKVYLALLFGVAGIIGCGSGQPPHKTEQLGPAASPQSAATPVEPTIALNAPVEFRESRIQIRPTSEYEKGGFGFVHVRGQGQINIQFMVEPFSSRIARVPNGLQFTGQVISRTEELPVSSNGLSRRLFILTTKTSGVNDWLLVVGTNRWTTDVRVLVPTSYESEIATKLRAILLSVDSIPGDTRPVDSVGGFHLAESKLLIPAQVTGLIVDYTLTGDMKLKSAADPLMQFRALTFEGKKGSEEEIANSLLNSIYAISNVEVTTRQPIELAGMHGVEIEATGQKTKAATPVAIYQLVLFREKGNLTVHGTVGTDAPERETTLAEFRRMARGLTRE